MGESLDDSGGKADVYASLPHLRAGVLDQLNLLVSGVAPNIGLLRLVGRIREYEHFFDSPWPASEVVFLDPRVGNSLERVGLELPGFLGRDAIFSRKMGVVAMVALNYRNEGEVFHHIGYSGGDGVPINLKSMEQEAECEAETIVAARRKIAVVNYRELPRRPPAMGVYFPVGDQNEFGLINFPVRRRSSR